MSLTRKQLIYEAWRRNNTDFLLHDGQRVIEAKFREKKNQLFVMNIARQFGKSYWGVKTADNLARSTPNARIKYGTAFHEDLIEFILPAFESILKTCPADFAPTYKVHGSRWVYKNGSEIKLIGLDRNPNKLRGNTVDGIILDEVGFMSNLSYLYNSIIIPATTHRPSCPIIMYSTPPNTPAHEFSDFVQLAQLRDSYVELDIYQNPMLTEADIDRLADAVGGKDSTTFRREFLCQFILDDELALVKEWKDAYIQTAPLNEYFNYYHKYVAMDLGRKDHTALVFGYYDFQRAIFYVQDELTMHGPDWTTVTLKERITAKERELWGEAKPFRRISDNNNPHLIQDLNSLHDIHFNETNKESLEAMVNEVRIMVGNGQIVVDPKCKMTIGCLKFGIWDKKRKEFSRSKVYGHFDHFASLVYLIRNLAKNVNPIPIDHGKANHTAWLYNVRNQRNSTHNARILEQSLIRKTGRR